MVKSAWLFMMLSIICYPTALTAGELDFSLKTLTIPNEHGSITEVSEGNGPTILLISNILMNYEAQKDVAAILEFLIQKYNLRLVLVEGGSRNNSLAHLRTSATPEKRRQVAEEFLREGKISGENYLDLVSDYNFIVYGVEDPALYNAQVMGNPGVVFERQKAMVKNSLEQIRDFHVTFAVLIANKSLAPGLCSLFKEGQIAYAVITPKHTAFTREHQKRLDKVMRETFIPMKQKDE